MKTVGIERIDQPVAETWARLSDLERLGESLPEAQAVDVQGDDRFTAAFRPQTGLGSTPVRMTFTVTERRENERLKVHGEGGAAEFAVNLDASFDLVDDGGATQVHWSVDVHLHGVLRSLTQRVLPHLISDQVAAVLGAARDRTTA